MTDEKKTNTGLTIASVVLLIGAIASNSKPLADGIMGVLLVLVAFTEKAPLGLSSFLLALGLGMLILPPLRFIIRRRFPTIERDAELRRFIAGALALFVGTATMYAQLHTLQGLLTGILAGLLAPWLMQGLQALWNFGARLLSGGTPP